MKAFMKKLTAGVLSAVIITTLLAGCGEQKAAEAAAALQVPHRLRRRRPLRLHPKKPLSLNIGTVLAGSLGTQ